MLGIEPATILAIVQSVAMVVLAVITWRYVGITSGQLGELRAERQEREAAVHRRRRQAAVTIRATVEEVARALEAADWGRSNMPPEWWGEQANHIEYLAHDLNDIVAAAAITFATGLRRYGRRAPTMDEVTELEEPLENLRAAIAAFDSATLDRPRTTAACGSDSITWGARRGSPRNMIHVTMTMRYPPELDQDGDVDFVLAPEYGNDAAAAHRSIMALVRARRAFMLLDENGDGWDFEPETVAGVITRTI